MANILIPIAIGAALSIMGGMIVIIFTTLNKGINKNSVEIKDIKAKYVTKDDFNRQSDKVDAKLDKIIDILMEVKKWKLKLFTY